MVFFTGQSLQDDTFYNEINVPGYGMISLFSIQSAIWDLEFTTTDHVVYNIEENRAFVYQEAAWIHLPGLNASLPVSTGGTDSINNLLTTHPLVVFNSDLWSYTVQEPFFASSRGSTPLIAGDINGDNVVDLTDTILVLQLMSGQPPAATIYNEAAVNGQSIISLNDAVYTLQHLADP